MKSNYLNINHFLNFFTIKSGLAGPNVTVFNSIKAQDIFKMNKTASDTIKEDLLENGPFILTTPPISVYSEHICLWV